MPAKKPKTNLICQECGQPYQVKPSHAPRSKFCSHHCHVVSKNKRRVHNLVGQKFNRWTVIEQRGTAGRGSLWLCRCKCGSEKVVPVSSLLAGESQSCGCYSREKSSLRAKVLFTKHGLSDTLLYWRLKAHHKRQINRDWTVAMAMMLDALQPVCVICGSSDRLETDHVQPESAGNGLRPGNAVKLCRRCNRAKHAKRLDQLPVIWRNKIEQAAQQFKLAWEAQFSC